jgi:hypothetical protein
MRQATIQRVEQIYDLLGQGGYWSTQELTDALGWPKGTLSPFISYLASSNNVICHKEKYKLPDFPKAPNYVAIDVVSQRKIRLEKRLEKRLQMMANLKITPQPLAKNSEPLNLFKGEEFETIQVKIQKAIELLKSNGYKILAKKTEYTEI